MVTQNLAGCRLLIVEDEYYAADDIQAIVTECGATVLGPVPTAKQADELIAANPGIDGVLLDVNLRGVMAYDLADSLEARGIPFALVTGYDHDALPPRFSNTPRLQKPVNAQELIRLLGTLASNAAPH